MLVGSFPARDDLVCEVLHRPDIEAVVELAALLVAEDVDRLEDRESSTGLEDAMELRERRRLVGQVDEYGPRRDHVDRPVRKG